MTGRARYRLTDAIRPRVLVAAWAAVAVAAAVVAVWFFADGRPIFGVAWLVLAIGWAVVAFAASRVWDRGRPRRGEPRRLRRQARAPRIRLR